MTSLEGGAFAFQQRTSLLEFVPRIVRLAARSSEKSPRMLKSLDNPCVASV
ncbi:MAG TPA: hypothetical protein VER11_27475 [Polyangiaceae bacterium]|nr:hypothetical protein [Polyangiaceae bacterium]